ncbi:hypothetical protein YC2023_000594 [Brassica napus]
MQWSGMLVPSARRGVLEAIGQSRVYQVQIEAVIQHVVEIGSLMISSANMHYFIQT